MLEVKIEKNVPFPTKHVTVKWPFDQLEIGDSFAAPVGKLSNLYVAVMRHSVEGKKFIVRKIDNTHCRVWRIS